MELKAILEAQNLSGFLWNLVQILLKTPLDIFK